MDWKNNALIYTQEFPEKSLDGKYVFESKVLGQPVVNSGNWSLVLYDYSQTTTVTRLGPQGKLQLIACGYRQEINYIARLTSDKMLSRVVNYQHLLYLHSTIC